MNTISRLALAAVACGLAIPTASALALSPIAIEGQLAAMATRDADNKPANARQTQSDLLTRSRQAIKSQDWQTAETLLRQAEEIKVEVNPFQFGGDTPKKVRRELEKARAVTGAAKPTSGFQPGIASNNNEVGSQNTPPRALEANPLSRAAKLPTLSDRQSRVEPNAFGRRSDLAPPAEPEGPRGFPDNRLAANNGSMLLEARKALALGDVRRASEFVEKAKLQGNAATLHGDSPAKVEEAIRLHRDTAERPATQRGSESFARLQGKDLLSQAEGLLRYNEFDEATRLAEQARRLPVSFTPFEANPETMLKRIADTRSAGTPSKLELLPPVADNVRPLPAVAGAPDKGRALQLVRQARDAIRAGDFAGAERMALEADALRVPDSQFSPQDDRPALVFWELDRIRATRVSQANAVAPIDTTGAAPAADRAVYDPAQDRTTNVQATAVEPTPLPPTGAPVSEGMRMFADAEESLRRGDRDRARALLERAYERRNELDPAIAARTQDYLQLLSQRPSEPRGGSELIDQAALAQQALYRQVSADLSRREDAARKLQATDPQAAAAALREGRVLVENSKLDTSTKGILLRRAERSIQELDTWIASNRPKLELQARNQAVENQIDRERQVKVEVEEKLAMLVDKFNTLMDERRFPEAEVVAKQAREIAPDEVVVKQISLQVKQVAAFAKANDIRDRKQIGTLATLNSVDEAAIPHPDSIPYAFPDTKRWEDLTKSRKKILAELEQRSERDIEINNRLKTPVSLKYNAAPLSVVIDDLQRLAQVNMVLDPLGLQAEAIPTDTPITIDLTQEISLKSALTLILQPLHLTFVVKNEVLKITSESLRDDMFYQKTYAVADLVIPIPNFVSSGNDGMSGMLYDAVRQQVPGFGFGAGMNGPPMGMTSAGAALNSGSLDPKVLAQLAGPATSARTPGMGVGSEAGGPGGLGGGSNADFDSLMELIETTIAPDSWESVGGRGAMAPFPTNLTLVISQTQEVHEQIVDLLDQLRRLQDLQVTIEVRFITLNDSFFERIGVDFDFDIDDNSDRPFQVFGRPDPNFGQDGDADSINPPRNIQDRDHGPTTKVGLSGPTSGSTPLFSADLDIPFRQGSFGVAVPQFGGFDASSASSIGFAILSDIEAYFFIEAAQGDRRSNILQAPKVTLFNGQSALVQDTTQSPFVVSVVPVVGDFAAAQQPVIVVLNEGTNMSVQAVVSPDRRFVRLTVVPFFSQIGDVQTFTFTGSSTTTEESDEQGPEDDTTGRNRRTVQTREGTTVQQPEFSFFTVSTTVSVPDGGTVLLGGVKRAREGRNEAGTPLLSKIPYINRLFRNVGIGRETQSLMMMVTPRIIIQEEEEALLGILPEN